MEINKKDSTIKSQTDHIFNMCEKPVMNFICKFLDETPNILFKDKIPTFSEPLIIKPISNFDKDKVIIFQVKTFKNVDEYNNNKKDDINNIIQYNEIKEAIGFLFYSIKNVYGPIVSETLINNKPMLNNILELNYENWTFYPKYVNNTLLKINFLKQTLDNICELKKNNQNDNLKLIELNKEYDNINSILYNIEEDKDLLENDIKNDNIINKNYYNKPVIGIILNLVDSKNLNKFLSTI